MQHAPTNLSKGIPELPDNYLSAFIVNVTLMMFALWFLLALYFIPLNIVFFPSSLMVLLGIPVLCMKLPVYIISKARMRLGIKDTTDTGLLEMKVMGAATVVTIISGVAYADFYVDPSMWVTQVGEAIDDILTELSFTFSLDLSITLSWPSNLSLPQQFPLILSVGILSVQNGEKLFKYIYRKYKVEEWGTEEMKLNNGKWARWSNPAKTILEALLLSPARFIAIIVRKYNARRVKILERRISAISAFACTVNFLKKKQRQMLVNKRDRVKTGHIDALHLRDYVRNNPEIEEIDLKGCTMLVGLPEELGELKMLKSVNFDGCANLEGEVNLPTIESLPEGAFRGCAKLEKVTLPAVTDVGDKAFMGCAKLKEVKLSSKNLHLGDGCFQGCSALRAQNIHGCDDFKDGIKAMLENAVNADLKIAVKEWLEDEKKARKKYGDISEWDTSLASNMANLV